MAEIDLNVASTTEISSATKMEPSHPNYERMLEFLNEIESRRFGWDGKNGLPIRQDSSIALRQFMERTFDWGDAELAAATMDESGVPVLLFRSPISRKQVRIAFPCAGIIHWAKLWNDSQADGVFRYADDSLHEPWQMFQNLVYWTNKTIITP